MTSERGGGRTSAGQKVPRVLAGVLAVRLGLGALVVLTRMTAGMLRALIWMTVLVALRPLLLVSLAHTRAPGEDLGAEAR